MIDAGVNLASPQFDQDLEAVIQRAKLAGVQRLLTIGTDLASSRQCINIAQCHSSYVFSTAGIHPHNADGADASALDLLQKLAQQPQVRAVGEAGLDYNRNFSSPENQRRAFDAQLEIAVQLRKPVYLHERDAFSDQLSILHNYRDRLAGGVAHCFTGTLKQARAYLDLGLHIGITGWLCDPVRGEQLRQTVKHIPLERLLLETDAPYLLPRHVERKNLEIPKKRRNEPCLLPLIGTFLADLIACSPQQLSEITSRNASSLFQLNPENTAG